MVDSRRGVAYGAPRCLRRVRPPECDDRWTVIETLGPEAADAWQSDERWSAEVLRRLGEYVWRSQARDLARMRYAKFLRTPYWRAVSHTVRERDGHTCQRCGASAALQVHHLTYDHRGREWEHLADLVTLCDSCHVEEHRQPIWRWRRRHGWRIPTLETTS